MAEEDPAMILKHGAICEVFCNALLLSQRKVAMAISYGKIYIDILINYNTVIQE
jgi:hypothetical protein